MSNTVPSSSSISNRLAAKHTLDVLLLRLDGVERALEPVLLDSHLVHLRVQLGDLIQLESEGGSWVGEDEA